MTFINNIEDLKSTINHFLTELNIKYNIRIDDVELHGNPTIHINLINDGYFYEVLEKRLEEYKANFIHVDRDMIIKMVGQLYEYLMEVLNYFFKKNVFSAHSYLLDKTIYIEMKYEHSTYYGSVETLQILETY